MPPSTPVNDSAHLSAPPDPVSDVDVRLELARLAACQIDAAVAMLQRENSRERLDQDLLDFCLARIRELARVGMSVQDGEGAWSTADLMHAVSGLPASGALDHRR